jgi:SAM-dependent methyltransferase
MIDKIYTRHTSEKPEYRLWDEYFHRQAAPRAVRNRKAYFKKLVCNTLKEKKSITLLNVGSGPGRDLAELYESLYQPQRLHTTSVDMDARAIAYAQELNKPYARYTRFVNRNILRFQSEQNFNLIWSAGLFDYFNDKVFVSVMRRFRNNLKPGGEIVIGNFNEENNPSREYMEIFGEWFLHHRSEQQLYDLAQKAGFSTNEIAVNHEPENVNLFLHVKPV